MWKVILGHNPFFGIHHGSAKAGMLRSLQFQDARNIAEFMERALDAGIDSMMASTHPRAIELRDAIVHDYPRLQREMSFQPLLPYMQKYVRAANENGIVSMLTSMLGQMGVRKSTSVFLKAGFSALFNDVTGMLQSLLEMEMSTFRDLRCERVYLHNALTDLAIGLNTPEPVEIFRKYVENKLGLQAGFGTLNLPFALRRFAEWGHRDAYFMAPFNKRGHQMNPSLGENEAALREFPQSRILAMSTLASGQLDPEEAYEYLAQFPNIDSVVVGISSDRHLRSTVAALQKHGARSRRPALVGS
jgi:hypothetical protein